MTLPFLIMSHHLAMVIFHSHNPSLFHSRRKTYPLSQILPIAETLPSLGLNARITHSLRPPYGIRQAIIFLPCGFFLSFYLLSSFPRLISAVADWTSTILLHMMWPLCEFRIHVWNMLHVARWKRRTQKVAKNRHLSTFATKAHIDNRKRIC